MQPLYYKPSFAILTFLLPVTLNASVLHAVMEKKWYGDVHDAPGLTRTRSGKFHFSSRKTWNAVRCSALQQLC